MTHAFRLVAMASLAMACLPAQDVADWREDLRFLARELPARHKNAFAHMPREEWSEAVRRLDDRLGNVSREQTIVEFMRLVAMVKDAHTHLAPESEAHMAFHRFPVRLYDFADGLFIVSADKAHGDMVGARVLRIGHANCAEAMTAVADIIPHEGRNWVRARAASLLTIPEVLAGLGLTPDALAADFVVEQAGQQRTVSLQGTEAAAGPRHAAAEVDMADGAAGDEPLWQQHPGKVFWSTVLADHTLYICYRAVNASADGITNEQFFQQAFAAADNAKVERIVLDMRNNGGGNNALNRFVIREILRRPALDQPDRLLVLIGRRVFSAAQNLVNELDFYTNATFVGEPTGNAPNQYGDARVLELSRSHFHVFVSSIYWQSHSPGDDRPWFTPDVFVEMTSADHGARRDPVLATALSWASGPGLASAVSGAAEHGDAAAVCRLVEAHRANDENRYRDVERDVNAVGYRLLHAGRTTAALTVFQANAAVFPHSANTFDSLGEALERAGRRDEAITAYRAALAIDPGFASSLAAMKRLGN